MEKINGEWYMMGCEKSDPKLLRTADDLLELLRHIGFLPLFAGEIAGFSVEERTLASSWWSGDIQSDPWEWRIALAGHPEIAYGKFFDKKAGFIHRDFFPMFANYRRNGYDFDSLFDEGLVPHRAKRIMDVFEQINEAGGNEIMSNELKEKAGFNKEGGEKNFEGVLTELQMQTYLIVSDFRQRKNKNGEEFGWHIGVMKMPETKWGYDFISSQYNEEPSDSWQKIVAQIRSFFPHADEQQIQKTLGIKYPGVAASSVKPQKKTVPKPSKPEWPENILKEIGSVPLKLNEDQMAGLYQAIHSLKEIEQDVIRKYFEEYLTQKEIGGMLSVSVSRVGHIKKYALCKLRYYTRADLIRYGLRGKERRIVQIKSDCRNAKSRDEQMKLLKEVRLSESGLSSELHFRLEDMGWKTLGKLMEILETSPSRLVDIGHRYLIASVNILAEYGVDFSDVYEKFNNIQTQIYIEELDFSCRLFNILHREGLRTLDQLERLIKHEPEKIMQIKGLGKQTRAELLSKLEKAGVDISPIRNLRK